jgi:hypothetical protein
MTISIVMIMIMIMIIIIIIIIIITTIIYAILVLYYIYHSWVDMITNMQWAILAYATIQ